MMPYRQGMSNPIEHVIIIVKENHTFDNYFGTFPGANGMELTAAADPVSDPPTTTRRGSPPRLTAGAFRSSTSAMTFPPIGPTLSGTRSVITTSPM
jgi:phospholipase C